MYNIIVWDQSEASTSVRHSGYCGRLGKFLQNEEEEDRSQSKSSNLSLAAQFKYRYLRRADYQSVFSEQHQVAYDSDDGVCLFFLVSVFTMLAEDRLRS